jgi:hypothetical protein
MYYMILLLHFADTSWTSGKWKENRINYSCRKGVGVIMLDTFLLFT